MKFTTEGKTPKQIMRMRLIAFVILAASICVIGILEYLRARGSGSIVHSIIYLATLITGIGLIAFVGKKKR